jgi:hypothetical protein
MIDMITIVTSPLTDDKINNIVWRNGLQTNSKDGVVCYSNEKTKNFIQQKGIYINIDTSGRLRAEGSLHKYFNDISGNDRNNYNMFLMSDAKKTIERLLFDKGIDKEDARVYGYEIGLNLIVTKDCRVYLEKMKTIGAVGDERELYVNPLYVNPRHKNERMKVTGFKKVRKYFKVYDKVHECIDKKRKVIPEGNILRIETVYKRLDKCTVIDFFTPDNLQKMVEAFFRDWRTIQFDRDIITPKGTGRAKQHLCMEIMSKGKAKVLQQAKERHANGSLTDRGYRNIREFITGEWDEVKKHITFIQSEEEKEFRQLMKVNHTILRNDEIGK